MQRFEDEALEIAETIVVETLHFAGVTDRDRRLGRRREEADRRGRNLRWIAAKAFDPLGQLCDERARSRLAALSLLFS